MKFRHLAVGLCIGVLCLACGKKEQPAETKPSGVKEGVEASGPAAAQSADDDLTEEDDEEDMGDDEGEEETE